MSEEDNKQITINLSLHVWETLLEAAGLIEQTEHKYTSVEEVAQRLLTSWVLDEVDPTLITTKRAGASA